MCAGVEILVSWCNKPSIFEIRHMDLLYDVLTCSPGGVPYTHYSTDYCMYRAEERRESETDVDMRPHAQSAERSRHDHPSRAPSRNFIH